MPLAEQGQRAAEPSFGILDHQVPRGPAGPWHRAAGFLQRQEEFVAQERLAVPQQGIPTRRINLRDAVEKPRAALGHASRTRGSTKGSASARSKNLSAPSAAMHPVPAEVPA